MKQYVIGFELYIVHVSQIGTFYFDFIIEKIYLQIHLKVPNYLFIHVKFHDLHLTIIFHIRVCKFYVLYL